MKRINKKLLEALDKLIAKYSGEEIECMDKIINCPLCDLYIKPKWLFFDYPCRNCPNGYFNKITGCYMRGINFDKLDYTYRDNYPTLKQFWTDYKSLYLQRKYSNSEIMEILIAPFKEEKK